jgi:RIO kinase 1
MRIPSGLQPLIDDGIIDNVVGQLQSGKEATVYVVERGDEVLCAKVYKSSEHRSFQHVAEYREGRRGRGSRNARAAGKRSRHGRKVEEAQWKTAEADAMYKLVDAGVRVPTPHGIHEGVLLMELVRDAHGDTAPRINEVEMSAEQAREWHAFMITEIVRMLCAGIIHGDLSEFNVLLGADGPVIIDLPQAVDAASNNNAFRMFERDVNNMRETFARAAPELEQTDFAREIWEVFEAGDLTPDATFTGHFVADDSAVDVEAVLDEIAEARFEAEARQLGREEADS